MMIGEERLYVVKSIPALLEAMETGTPVEFGKGFTFHPEWMRFGPTENRILGILRAMCLAQKEGGVALRGAEQREMALPAPYAEAILQELRKEHGLTQEQVAERMALDVRWVYRLHGRALLMVKVPEEFSGG